MAVFYLQHPIHGGKVACTDGEAAHDRANGWVDFDPTPSAVPSFLSPKTPASSLPEDFPGREQLAGANLLTMESLVGLTAEDLQKINGIGAATAKRILDAQ